MRTKASPKCLHCNEPFVADPRNQWHQSFCRKPVCQRASKADSQRRWTLKPGNETYFSGAVNTERVRVWRLANPNYRRRKGAAPESVQQDVLNPQVAAIEVVTPPEPRSVLQEICLLQPSLIVGLISIMTGHGQQDDIVASARLFVTPCACRSSRNSVSPWQRTPGDDRVPMDGKGPAASVVRIAVGAEKADASGVAACRCLQVTMGDNRGWVAAVWAASGLDLNAQVQKIQGAGLEEAAEFHAGTLSCHASPHFWVLSQVGCLNKTRLSVFHGPNMPKKTTVQELSQ